jgi:hypothetical protein
MRLINTKTLRLEEYFGDDIPKYAILSHTWGKDEITFQEFQDVQQEEKHGMKNGYLKILGTCTKALEYGLDYAWVDTCCIDKTSSSELTEAINSMFAWYAGCQRCFVYLSDVPTIDPLINDMEDWEINGRKVPKRGSIFAASLWFTRGWTLQELLAPEEVDFYDNSWKRFGSRSSLPHLLSVITRIDIDVIRMPYIMHSPTISAATKMSWAAYRTTKRIEDRAYSLLGIFGVYLPLLYGEGNHAFERLQEEIIRGSNDESIFASNWHGDLLPRSPEAFRDGARIVAWTETESETFTSREPYSLTNMGLHIQLPLLKGSQDGRFIGVLACRYQDDFRGPIGLDLSLASGRHNVYYVNHPRLLVVNLAEYNLEETAKFIYILQPNSHVFTRMNRRSFVPTPQTQRESKCLIRNVSSFEICNLVPWDSWNKDALTLWLPMCSTIEAAFVIVKPFSKRFAVLFSYTYSQQTQQKPSWSNGSVMLIPLEGKDSDIPEDVGILLDAHRSDLQSAPSSADFDVMVGSSIRAFSVKIERENVFGENVFVVDILQRNDQSSEMAKAVDSNHQIAEEMAVHDQVGKRFHLHESENDRDEDS